LADGVPVGQVAKALGISRRYLYMWRDRPGHQERLKPMWEAAMKMSAEADLENSTMEFDRLDREIMDDNGETIRRIPAATEVQLVSGRAKFRQWLAAKKDPERFGDKNGVEVNLNFGDLHLQALQGAKASHALAPPVIEAEVIEEDEDEGLAALIDGPVE
jgi:hypothetical protein